MTITLHCNLCGTEIEGSEAVILELQHWLIIKSPTEFEGITHEEHFCCKCSPEQEKSMEEQREEVAGRLKDE